MLCHSSLYTMVTDVFTPQLQQSQALSQTSCKITLLYNFQVDFIYFGI